MSKALCYNKETKQFYVGYVGSSDSLFAEYDNKGYKTTKIEVQNEPIEIIISSNLNYQGASYLYAKIKIRGKYLLNFKDTHALYCINKSGLTIFSVSAGDWQELFDIIVKNCNTPFISESDIERYLSEVENMIQSESISVYRNKTAQTSNLWKGVLLVLLHSMDVLSNIIENKDESILFDNKFFEDRLLKTCKIFLKKFSECYESFERKEKDTRINRLSKKLITVCEYIDKYGKPLEYVDLLTNKITK